MASEHAELGRMAKDTAALTALTKLRAFGVTAAISKTYEAVIQEYFEVAIPGKRRLQQEELMAVAQQEQLNVLQPLIYNDPLLKITMDTNHRFSRRTDGWLSPKFKVIYSASAKNDAPTLETVFDAPSSTLERFAGELQSLPDPSNRIKFLKKIAEDFNSLMKERRPYMDAELQKIAGWMTA